MARPRLPINETAVLEAYAAGETVPGIALRLNVDRSRVDRVLDDHTVARRNDRGRHRADGLPALTQHPAGSLVGNTPAWMDDAACAKPGVNPDIFFPEVDRPDTARTAALICATCPVARRCATYAIDNNEPQGVWGGLSPMGRRRLRRNPTLPLPSLSPAPQPPPRVPQHPSPPYHGGERTCPRCESAVPKERRSPYCSDDCRLEARRASYRRAKAKQRVIRDAS